MTPRLVTSARADEDIDGAIAYYVDAGAHEAALDLVDAIEQATQSLRSFPGMGSARLAVALGMDDVRTLSLDRFPFVIIYTDDADAVRIHRILHTSRDLGGLFGEG